MRPWLLSRSVVRGLTSSDLCCGMELYVLVPWRLRLRCGSCRSLTSSFTPTSMLHFIIQAASKRNIEVTVNRIEHEETDVVLAMA